jgi:3-hydroxybutyryl-CoA dehydrogenase
MTRHLPAVGVVGLGSVGEALLRLLRASGYEAIGVERELDVLARVDRRAKADETAAGHECVLTDDLAALSRADVVFEALPDDLTAKTEILGRLDRVCREHTVLVTTTAALPVTHLAVESGRPAQTLGLRCLRPPASGASAEPVHTAMSAAEAAATLNEVVSGLGLTPEPLGARAGLDATALVYAYLNRAVAMVEQGYADQHAVDTAMRLGCGLPAGPLELLDELGLDYVHSTLAGLHARTGDDSFLPAPLLTDKVRSGMLGRKSGQGFYPYDDLGRPIAPWASTRATGRSSPVQHVGLLGSGTMGRGIGAAAAAAGLRTVVVCRSREKADAAREAIEASLTSSVRRGRISAGQKETALALLNTTDDSAALRDCDLVIEAAAEDLTVKRALFARLGDLCRPDALLATTTSSLSVTVCADASGRPHDVLGLHFFNPAPVMKLVEVVPTPRTSATALASAHAFCERMGKTAVECPDRAGFIVNHLLFPYLADAIRLLGRGDVDVEQTDAAVKQGFGYPMGPFALLDTIGLDVSLAILRTLHEQFPTPDYAPPHLLERLVVLGCLGRKSGHGFHRTAREPFWRK